jgi:hypothetical protein
MKDKRNRIERHIILAKLSWKTSLTLREISGFCHEVDESCTLLSYYAMSNVTFLSMFEFLALEDGIERSS